MALTDQEIIALELPQLATPFTKNGVTFTTPTAFIAAMYSYCGNSLYKTLWTIFEMLASEDMNSSLRLGEFEFTKRTGQTFDERRYYWQRQYRGSVLFGQQGVAPTIGYNYWPSYPAVR